MILNVMGYVMLCSPNKGILHCILSLCAGLFWFPQLQTPCASCKTAWTRANLDAHGPEKQRAKRSQSSTAQSSTSVERGPTGSGFCFRSQTRIAKKTPLLKWNNFAVQSRWFLPSTRSCQMDSVSNVIILTVKVRTDGL